MMGFRKFRKRLRNAYGKFDMFTYLCGLRSTKTLSLPDFLGIGPPKAGTTWLCENLRCHPQIFVSREKEVHFFDLHLHKGLRFYSEKFKTGATQKKGEVTPTYYQVRLNVIKYIHSIMPNVKLIFILRNPIDQSWSQAIQNLATKPGRALQDVDESEFYEIFKRNPLFRQGGYMSVLGKWWSVFPSAQLYIGLYDDIGSQPIKILKEIFDHIGVSSDVDWSSFPHSEMIIPPVGAKYENYDKTRGVKLKEYTKTRDLMAGKYRDYLMTMYERDIEALGKNLGIETSRWLHAA